MASIIFAAIVGGTVLVTLVLVLNMTVAVGTLNAFMLILLLLMLAPFFLPPRPDSPLSLYHG